MGRRGRCQGSARFLLRKEHQFVSVESVIQIATVMLVQVREPYRRVSIIIPAKMRARYRLESLNISQAFRSVGFRNR